jgi:uncharacterized membrane protein YccC
MSLAPLTPEIQELLDRIIDRVDIEIMTPELRDRMRQNLARELDDFLLAGAIDALPEAALDEYEQLVLQQVEPKELQRFFGQQIPHLTQVLDQAVIDFAGQYFPTDDSA